MGAAWRGGVGVSAKERRRGVEEDLGGTQGKGNTKPSVEKIVIKFSY